MQKQASSTFGTLGRISDGEIQFSYSGASGTVGAVNSTMTITPTTLESINSSITNCSIKSGTTLLPSGFTINPLTCVISGIATSRLYSTAFVIEVTNSLGKSKLTTVELEAQTYYSISGTVTGLPSGQNITISNGVDTLIQSFNGTFSLNAIMQDTNFSITVLEGNSSRFTCSVTNGSGTATANVTNINIACTPSGSRVLSGTVIGLIASSSVTISTNSLNLPVSANGRFSFPSLPYATNYNVSITSATGGQTCVVAAGSGTLTDDIDTVSVVCQVVAANNFTLVGTIDGIPSGKSVTIYNNGSDAHPMNSNGTFVLSSISNGTSYNITATVSDSAFFSCTVTNGSGTISANVSNISVHCFESGVRSIGGNISGLAGGASISLTSNGITQNNLANGSFDFNLNYGDTYSFVISNKPAGYDCSATNATGTVSTPITNISISCGPLGPYTVSVNISGITASTISLTNGSDSILNSSNGLFAFSTSRYYGASYNILVTSTPTAHTCTTSTGSGIVTGNTVVNVVCTPNTYSLGGTYSGIEPAETAIVEVNSLNGTNSSTLNGVTSGVSTGFTFSNGLLYNQTYTVRLNSQPLNKICTLTNGTGTIYNNLSNVSVSCVARTANDCSFGSIIPWAGNVGFSGAYCDGTYMYVGGSFSGLGPQARHFAVINNTDTNPVPDARFVDTSYPTSHYDRIVISDGEGGWFTGGGGNGIHFGLRHFKSDLSLDPVFSSTLNYITALKVIGNSLYVGKSTGGLIKINRFTGAIDSSFNPNIVGNVNAMEYDGTYLYVVGNITSGGGVSKKGIVKINANTGVVDHSLSLNLTSDAAQSSVTNVYSIKFYNNNLYIAGDFGYANGNSSTPRLLKSSLTGVVDTTFTPAPNSYVYKLEVYQDKLLVGGRFTTILGQSKNGLAVIDIGNDHLLTNFYNETINGFGVSTMHLNPNNGYLYLNFHSSSANIINGQSRGFYAVYDLANKTILSQEAKVNGKITSFATYGDKVFLAGSFTSVYRDSQAYFARIKLSDGKRDETFNPSVSGNVTDLKFDSNTSALYMSGNFTSPKNYLAKFNLTTQTWDGVFTPALNNSASDFQIYDNKIFTIGLFTSPRTRFAVLDKNTGAAESTYPDLAPNSSPGTLAVNSYGAFLGGGFTTIDSLTTSPYIARIDHADGKVTENYFPAVPSASVKKIIPIGSKLIVSGSFTNYNNSGKDFGILFEQNPSVALDNTFQSSSISTTQICAIGTTLYSPYTTSLRSFNSTTGAYTLLYNRAGSYDYIQCQNSQNFVSGPGSFFIGP